MSAAVALALGAGAVGYAVVVTVAYTAWRRMQEREFSARLEAEREADR
jgi:hypothetical protein